MRTSYPIPIHCQIDNERKLAILSVAFDSAAWRLRIYEPMDGESTLALTPGEARKLADAIYKVLPPKEGSLVTQLTDLEQRLDRFEHVMRKHLGVSYDGIL